MNCLDFRRALTTGEDETGVMRVHRLGCVFCADLFREQAAFDGQVRRALEVPVPREFAGRILDTVHAAGSAAPRLNAGRRRFLAAAAVGAGAIGIGLFVRYGQDDPMAMACIQFVVKEEAKSIMMGAMPRDQAGAALATSLPLERLERIGKVMHVSPCPFQGSTAYHVVLMVPQDKVTLLVMPDSRLSARGYARHDGMYASVVPLSRGSVGIVGSSASVVESVAGALRA